jgi:hypothetical protein
MDGERGDFDQVEAMAQALLYWNGPRPVTVVYSSEPGSSNRWCGSSEVRFVVYALWNSHLLTSPK